MDGSHRGRHVPVARAEPRIVPDDREWLVPFEAAAAATRDDRHADAEAFLRAALSVAERLPLGHWHHAVTLENMAAGYCARGARVEAGALYERALGHWLGVTIMPFDDSRLATTLVNLAATRGSAPKSDVAPLLWLAYTIFDHAGMDAISLCFGPAHIWRTYDSHGRYGSPDRWIWPPRAAPADRPDLREQPATAPDAAVAELLERLASVAEDALGSDHPAVSWILDRGIAAAWRSEAAPIRARLLARWLDYFTRNPAMAPVTPDELIIRALRSAAAEVSPPEAETLLLRAIAIAEQTPAGRLEAGTLKALEQGLRHGGFHRRATEVARRRRWLAVRGVINVAALLTGCGIALFLIVAVLFAGGNLIFGIFGTLGLSNVPLRIALTAALLVVGGVATIVAIFAWMLSQGPRAGGF